MGTDIHALIEYHDGIRWVGHIDRCTAHDLYPGHYAANSEEGRAPRIRGALDDRNSSLFSILALGDQAIVRPRGIPDDLSSEVRRAGVIESEGEHYWLGEHSFSWLTLQELLNVDWDARRLILMGTVSVRSYREFKDSGHPSTYCGSVFGHNVLMVKPDEMERLIESGEADTSPLSYYTRVEWSHTYREAIGPNTELFTHALPTMQRLCDEHCGGDRERVRLVFGFDS